MKKIICSIFAVVLCLMCAACNRDIHPGNNTNNGNNGGNGHASPTTANSTTYDGAITEDIVRSHPVTPERDFSYENNGADGIRITDYHGKDSVVVIPEKINGKTVTAIPIAVFGNDSIVRGVLVPSGVKRLVGTFGNNSNLEVVIWEGAEDAGANLFNNCPNLHTVIFGDNLKNLGENAFAFCTSLKELYIPATVESLDTSIESTIFILCDNLTIKGKAGSYIETYCAKYGIPFQAV